MTKLAPSLLSADFSRLGDEIARLEEAGADWIHIDVMDGHFVPNITIGPTVICSIRKVTGLLFDVHLMIDKPERYIEDFARAGADILTVHWEATQHLNRTVRSIKEAGCKAGVSVNPATPVSLLDDIMYEVDLVLIMSVNPGFGGQRYIPSTTRKIKELSLMKRDAGLSFEIEVDGGITTDNAADVIKAGATVLVSGSGVFGAPSLKQRVIDFKRIFEAEGII
jgi:ribulose-phosphate 3-epimerase